MTVKWSDVEKWMWGQPEGKAAKICRNVADSYGAGYRDWQKLSIVETKWSGARYAEVLDIIVKVQPNIRRHTPPRWPHGPWIVVWFGGDKYGSLDGAHRACERANDTEKEYPVWIINASQ